MTADHGHEEDRPSITETRTSLYELLTKGLHDLNNRVTRLRHALADSDRPPPASDPEVDVSPVSRPTPVH